MKVAINSEGDDEGNKDRLVFTDDHLDNANYVDLVITTTNPEGKVMATREFTLTVDELYRAAALFKGLQEDRS